MSIAPESRPVRSAAVTCLECERVAREGADPVHVQRRVTRVRGRSKLRTTFVWRCPSCGREEILQPDAAGGGQP